MRRVLLLNPPARARYIRDQFCSHVSKGSYYWQPLDLLMLSGPLHAAGFSVTVVDAIVERLDTDGVVARIAGAVPEAVVFLTGSDSFDGDVACVTALKRAGVARAIGIGDILRDHGPRLLEAHPVIDACLTDIVVHGLLPFLDGRVDEAVNMVVRTPAGVRAVPLPAPVKTFSVPTPRYELFPLDRYRLPFTRFAPYAAVMASNWCPYPCTFCTFAATPYRTRDVANLLDNLRAVHERGIRHVHFVDWTFGVNRRHTDALLDGMVREGFDFEWSCLSRVDLVDRPLLERFAATGCRMIEFGVESGSQAILDRYRKQITVPQVRDAFAACRELGISTLATFVLGLPGDTRATLADTLALALDIAPTYCSFNVASPRMGSPLRREAVAAGTLAPDATGPLDSSWSATTFSDEQLSAQELAAFRDKAVRAFYFRPSYLWDRVRSSRSVFELWNQATNGVAMAWLSLRASARDRVRGWTPARSRTGATQA